MVRWGIAGQSNVEEKDSQKKLNNSSTATHGIILFVVVIAGQFFF